MGEYIATTRIQRTDNHPCHQSATLAQDAQPDYRPVEGLLAMMMGKVFQHNPATPATSPRAYELHAQRGKLTQLSEMKTRWG